MWARSVHPCRRIHGGPGTPRQDPVPSCRLSHSFTPSDNPFCWPPSVDLAMPVKSVCGFCVAWHPKSSLSPNHPMPDLIWGQRGAMYNGSFSTLQQLNKPFLCSQKGALHKPCWLPLRFDPAVPRPLGVRPMHCTSSCVLCCSRNYGQQNKPSSAKCKIFTLATGNPFYTSGDIVKAYRVSW